MSTPSDRDEPTAALDPADRATISEGETSTTGHSPPPGRYAPPATVDVPSTAGDEPSVTPRAGARPEFSAPGVETLDLARRDDTPGRAGDLADLAILGAEPSDGPRPAAAPPPTAAVPGYEILSELGRGGMGVVYKARQRGLNRTVALKMVLAGRHAGASQLARFRAEAEAVARLQHPNIVQIFDVGEYEGRPYFSLEYVPGGSLDRRLDGTPWQPEEAARLVETLARAVHAAHARGVVHRDLKPANVLMAIDSTPKVTDFGLAKRLDEEDGPTQSGAMMGTPSYMAPEQADHKAGAIGPATDVYALGAILYELLTGRPPFKGTTPLATVTQVVSDEPVAPSRLQPGLPRDAETICLRCLRKEPARRYISAQALAEDLRRFRAGEPILARPAGRLERAVKWVNRNPAAAAWLAAIPVLLTLGQTEGILAGCTAAAMSIPLARNVRSSGTGAILCTLAMLGILLVSGTTAPHRAGIPDEPFDLDRFLIPLASMAIFGWQAGSVVASIRRFFPHPGVWLLSLGLAIELLLLPYLVPLVVASDPNSGRYGLISGRANLISLSSYYAIVGLGMGLIAGNWVRGMTLDHPEREGVKVVGMAGAIGGVYAAEAAVLAGIGTDPVVYLRLLSRYPFPGVLLVQAYALGVGSLLGALIGAKMMALGSSSRGDGARAPRRAVPSDPVAPSTSRREEASPPTIPDPGFTTIGRCDTPSSRGPVLTPWFLVLGVISLLGQFPLSLLSLLWSVPMLVHQGPNVPKTIYIILRLIYTGLIALTGLAAFRATGASWQTSSESASDHEPARAGARRDGLRVLLIALTGQAAISVASQILVQWIRF